MVLQTAFEKLAAAYGPQHWWPGETPFEVLVGAVLTQNTSWQNVERALDNLRESGTLDLSELHKIPTEELAELIRPCGYYNQKAKRLKNLVRYVVEQHHGDLRACLEQPLHELREQLLSVNGVGLETADSIVLYAAHLPLFVIDAYTARVLKRHGWIEPEADYHAMQDLFQRQLPEDVQLYNEFHALLVRVGKQFCGTKPKCEACPLNELLPAGGPLDWRL